MIRKYLICSKKNVYLQSKNSDSYETIGKVVELVLPIRDFWEIDKLVKEVNYQIASSEQQAEISNSYKRVMLRSAPFAVSEEDRNWLYGLKSK